MVWSCPMQIWYLFEVFIFYLKKAHSFIFWSQDIIIIIVIYNRKINKSFYFFLKCFYSIYLFMGKEYMSQRPCEGERQPKGICPPSTAVGPRDWTRVPSLVASALPMEATCHSSGRGVSTGVLRSKSERLGPMATARVSKAPHLHTAPREILNWWPKAIRLIFRWHLFHPSPRTCLSGQFISQPVRLLKFSSGGPGCPIQRYLARSIQPT